MSKMSDLSLILDELKKCGETLIDVSDTLREFFSTPEPDSQPEPETVKEEPKPVTFEQVRAALAKKTRVSKENTDAIRELLLKHGAGKLSEIKPEEYAVLLKEAEVIPDA